MFLLPDELFVSEAYGRVLRRPADPAGYLSYLRALRKGRLSRAALVADLMRSDEARQASAQAPAAPAWFTAPDLWPAHRARRLSGWRGSRRDMLLALPDDIFVEACAAASLGRHATAQERRAAAAATAATAPGATDLGPSDRMARWTAWQAQAPAWRRAAPIGWFAQPVLGPGGDSQGSAEPSSAPSTTAASLSAAAAGAPQPAVHASEAAPPQRPPPCPSGTVFFTIATRSYLPQVRVLMRSLAEHHPTATRLVLLVDTHVPDDPADPWQTVPVQALGLEGLGDMSLRYDILELCTAVKPFFFRWLMGEASHRRLVYLDPDIRCHAPLDEALAALDRGHSSVLTPHITEPLPQGAEPDDHVLLRSGTFNLGFAAFDRSPEAQRFVAWWADKLRTQCRCDFAANLFTDQRWCDFAPSFLPGLHIWRHPGANLAYWNLASRRIEPVGSGWQVDGRALVFAHFSGLDPTRPDRFSRYQAGSGWDAQPGLASLTAAYADELLRAGWRQSRGVTCWFASVDGVPWVDALRRHYRLQHPGPAQLTRTEALQAALAACATSPQQPTSELMLQIHGHDSDLQRHFDLGTRSGVDAYGGWFWSTGVAAHGLAPLLRRERGLARSPDSAVSRPRP